jgi:hypothetical protein
MMGVATFDEQIKAGKGKLQGNRGVYEQLKSTLVQFNLYFELMPGTKKAVSEKSEMNPLEEKVKYVGE